MLAGVLASMLAGVLAYLDASMAAQVEVELRRVSDGAVHRGSGRDVPALPHLRVRTGSDQKLRAAKLSVMLAGTDPLGLVGAEQAGVVTFLDHDVRDSGPVVLLQTDAGLPDGDELGPGYLEHPQVSGLAEALAG